MRSKTWLRARLNYWRARHKRTGAKVAEYERRLKAWKPPEPAVKKEGPWHSGAIKQPVVSAGAFLAAPARGVLHTTESTGIPRFTPGTEPHFCLDPKNGRLVQYVPIDEASRSLEHPAGTMDTNRMHAIQVELVGFARDTPNWTDGELAEVAKLMRWVERNAGVHRACAVKFAVPAKRMLEGVWHAYSGWCGHEHVPNQPSGHWDPGAFPIERTL